MEADERVTRTKRWVGRWIGRKRGGGRTTTSRSRRRRRRMCRHGQRGSVGQRVLTSGSTIAKIEKISFKTVLPTGHMCLRPFLLPSLLPFFPPFLPFKFRPIPIHGGIPQHPPKDQGPRVIMVPWPQSRDKRSHRLVAATFYPLDDRLLLPGSFAVKTVSTKTKRKTRALLSSRARAFVLSFPPCMN
jgi:hypothetical protein